MPDLFTGMVYSLATHELLIAEDDEFNENRSFRKLREGLSHVIVGIETPGAGFSFSPFNSNDAGKIQSVVSILVAKEGSDELDKRFNELKTTGARATNDGGVEFLSIGNATRSSAGKPEKGAARPAIFVGNPIKNTVVISTDQDSIVLTMNSIRGVHTDRNLTIPKSIRERVAQSARYDWGFMFGGDELQPPKIEENKDIDKCGVW